ncbi:hypothetical protein SPRG_09744 [Saprolegnia parasitica CBS 223.65]|uniref:ELYS-like domain-containing protein n=1 Tax=Saprolegnia parasitica (strain CBS 223.65) TaxID=695850 RepID=A0A067C2K1_SAPPC|nr:hypothetical protein SPRG_09744 [Saprolegnia parasitica CBS 223.65]KDO25014.1 hypothetical protein SPRG_09744 [Saprolegnia parasitica CBS 223.65]|eukprot:XP_012204283.1 hypothetical protein SPRG_09744 [Saprolegnia parasitica CBS 223.65]
MAFVNVLMSAHLLPLVTAYQEGVNQDVRILTRLGHSPPALGGDLGPVHAVMAPWLDRVGFRFLHQLCPTLVFSYALEYGRVDLVRELMATDELHLSNKCWYLDIIMWRSCAHNHRHLQSYVDSIWPAYLELCIVQELLNLRAISSCKAYNMRLAAAIGKPGLVALLLKNSSGGMALVAFREAVAYNQLALLQCLCTQYNEPVHWRIALQATNLQHDMIHYVAPTHDLRLSRGSARATTPQASHQRLAYPTDTLA